MVLCVLSTLRFGEFWGCSPAPHTEVKGAAQVADLDREAALPVGTARVQLRSRKRREYHMGWSGPVVVVGEGRKAGKASWGK